MIGGNRGMHVVRFSGWIENTDRGTGRILVAHSAAGRTIFACLFLDLSA